MIDFKKIEDKYCSDAAFNKITNILRRCIEEHGFLPSELREAMFYAQYTLEMSTPYKTIRTQEDWDKIAQARELMKSIFVTKDFEK